MIINKNTLSKAKNWIRPTVREVEIILNEVLAVYKIEFESLGNLIGINNRTIRRWKNKSSISPAEISKIPYSEWAKIIFLARGEIIFGDIIVCDKSKIPTHLIKNFQNFKPIFSDDMKKFIGESSITGLTRMEISRIFKWNSNYFSDAIAKNTTTFSTISLLLILCGIEKEKIFYI